jgi:hypothetical protein
MKKLLNHLSLIAISISALSACSSTSQPSIIESSTNIPSDTSLQAVLLLENDEYKIDSFLKRRGYIPSNGFNQINNWFLDNNLMPDANTQRFECKVKEEECDKYENHESPFVKVSGLQSDYGDTYSERFTEAKIEQAKTIGYKVFEGTKNTVMGVLAAPGLVLFAGTFGTLAGGINLATSGTVWINKWVEFDHDAFVEKASEAIIEQYGSIDNYVKFIEEVDSVNLELEAISNSYSNIYNTKIGNHKSSLAYELKPFNNKDSSTDLFRFEIYSTSIPRLNSSGNPKEILAENKLKLSNQHNDNLARLAKQFNQNKNNVFIARSKLKSDFILKQNKEYSLVRSSKDINKFIERYSTIDLANLVPDAKKAYIKTFIKEQSDQFNKINTIAQATRFINKYQSQDLAKLVNSAEKNRKSSIEKYKNEFSAELTSWRRGLEVGDNTFCGYIIDKNASMVKISLNAKLPGYSNESWLHINEVFKPESSCSNRNGHVSPRYNPLIVTFDSKLEMISRS